MSLNSKPRLVSTSIREKPFVFLDLNFTFPLPLCLMITIPHRARAHIYPSTRSPPSSRLTGVYHKALVHSNRNACDRECHEVASQAMPWSSVFVRLASGAYSIRRWRRKNREKEGVLFCYLVKVQTEPEHHTLNLFNSLQESTSTDKYLCWLFEIQMSKLICFFICSF